MFKNAKINFLKKISVLSALFIELKYRWLQARLPNLKKHQTLEFWLMIDLYEILKKANFTNFLIILKVISCTYLYKCMCFSLCEHV